jgi:hypothetical protein
MYKALITAITVTPIEGANTIAKGNVLGKNVIVSKETKTGDLGIYFPPDGQLSEEFCKVHDLIRRKNPDTGKNEGGFFEETRRVRAQPFMGVKSDGFWCPISYVDYTGINLDELVPGYSFQELNGHKICNKYISPATNQRIRGLANNINKSTFDVILPRHYDTEQLVYNRDKITVGSNIIITEKLHGTSAATGNVFFTIEKNLNWLQRLWNKTIGNLSGFPKVAEYHSDYGTFSRTRNTILVNRKDISEESAEFYRRAAEKMFDGRLKKGEIIYYEIVGYDSHNAAIMNSVDNKPAGKEVVDKYGPKMCYSYGCIPGEFRVYVYRIVMVNEDGDETELPWVQVKRRCKELQLETVPELATYALLTETEILGQMGEGLFEDTRELLVQEVLRSVLELTEGSSSLDARHIKEGVCLRIEDAEGHVYVFKNKSWTFGVLEGYLKNNDDFVDPEESS